MKPHLPIFSFVLLLLFGQTCPVFCQQIIFNKVIPPDGKDFKWVAGITQDVNGYMWYATQKGLYRYDGYHMTTYKSNPINPNSLMSNNLVSVLADSNGIIWIGSGGRGLDRLDPVTGIFTHFRHDSNDPASLSNDLVTVILKDKQENLWIGTYGGLDQFDPKTNKFIHYRYNANDPTSISNNKVRAIYEDRQGTIWIGTGSPYPWEGGGPEEGGLNRMNKKSGTFTHYFHDPNNIHSLVNNKVSAIFEDNQGILWIGTAGNGLHRMNTQQGSFERIVYDPLHPGKLSGPALTKESPEQSHITFITQDAAGSFWIGSSDDGLNYFNPGNRKIIHYKGKDNSSAGINDIGVWKAFTSRDGILWIGTWQGNLYRIDPFQWNIPHYASPGVIINSFYEESAGILWIGTEEGLFRKDLTTGKIKQYVHDPLNPASLGNNYIQHILKDRQGNIWFGTHGGLDLLNQDGETFTHYRNDPKNSSSLSNDGLGFIYEDPQSKLWIVTSWGLNLMDRKMGTFTRYFFDPKDTPFGGDNITYVLKDSQGKLWVGSWGSLHLLNPQNGKFNDYLRGISIYSLCEDAQGNLWVGGSNGLYLYNRTSDVFTRFVDTGSLTDIPEAISVVEDNQRNLWICFTDGLIKLNAQRNETRTYGTNNGVSDLVLTYCHKGAQGKLYFSNSSGYFAFFPDQLNKNAKPPEIILTTFRLSDQVVKPGKQSPLTESLLQAKIIRLHYNQNAFSFDFAAIDYSNPQDNRHLYMLENYDNTWRQTGSELKAYYFNIPPGEYVFRVKAANSNGVWAEKKIDIIITPPWWRTWWAYFMYGLLLIAGVLATHRIQKKRVIEAERERTREKELEQAKEIEKAYHELKTTQAQLVQREKMASLGELTAGIAHEIQNPLNFVNNFSEVNTELADELEQEVKKENLDGIRSIAKDIKENQQKINHHGKRADAIVKGMLQHSRVSSGQKELTDINALCDEYLRLAYHGFRAKDKSFNIGIETHLDPLLPKVNVVTQDIGRVILNLINNAFYTVSEKGKQNARPDDAVGRGNDYTPTVTVSTKTTGDKIQISVTDNGNGIPQKVLDKIFQPFFTTKPTGQGTGLGLSLSYDIIKAHGGELNVETKEGENAEFIIELPIK